MTHPPPPRVGPAPRTHPVQLEPGGSYVESSARGGPPLEGLEVRIGDVGHLAAALADQIDVATGAAVVATHASADLLDQPEIREQIERRVDRCLADAGKPRLHHGADHLDAGMRGPADHGLVDRHPLGRQTAPAGAQQVPQRSPSRAGRTWRRSLNTILISNHY